MVSNLADRQGVFSGTPMLLPCRVVAATAITLSGLQTVDGVALALGDRVLVTGQADQTTNGVYIVSTTVWARSIDAARTGHLVRGTLVLITDGSHANFLYEVTSTDNPIVIGTSDLIFTATTIGRLSPYLFRPEDYGAKGDGVADDTKAFQDLTTAVTAAGGGTIWMRPGANYLVFNSGQPTQTVMMFFYGLGGVHICCNGAIFTIGRTWGVSDIVYLILIENSHDFVIDGFRAVQTNGTVLPVSDFYGTKCLQAQTGVYGLTINNASCLGCVSLLETGLVANVTLINCGSIDSIYGVTIVNNEPNSFSENVQIIGLLTSGVERSLFLKGARNLWASITSHNPIANDILITQQGTSADIDNVEILYRQPARTSVAFPNGQNVYMGFGNSPVSGAFRNIKITIDVDQAGYTQAGAAVMFSKGTTAAGGLTYENIEISGNVRNIPTYSATPVMNIFAAADAPWSGETIKNIRFDNLTLDAAAPGAVFYINGGGVPAGYSIVVRDVSAPNVALSAVGYGPSEFVVENSFFYNGNAYANEYYTGPPTWTGSSSNPAIGNGTLGAAWWRDGKAATFNVRVAIGSTTTMGTGNWQFAPNAAAVLTPSPIWYCVGMARAKQGSTVVAGIAYWAASTGFLIITDPATGNPYSATVPFTWANGDTLDLVVNLVLH